MSRVVSGLIERGLILRGADENDGRGVQLSLTRSGARVHVGLISAAKERNDALLGCLTKEEAECLDRVLVKLADAARALVRNEEQPAGRKNKGAA
jgi:DNA-binding MarR family transcriptional regulator